MKSKLIYTNIEADEIISLIKEKLSSDSKKQKGIRAKIRSKGFWGSEFGFRDSYTVADFLNAIKIINIDKFTATTSEIKKSKPSESKNQKQSKTSNSRSRSDEQYVIDLYDEILKQKALRQHRFDFLKGDSGIKLPVDAYYPKLSLVVEFRERQHTESVPFFDKRQTVSGVSRDEQRRLYDQRRREVLPKYGIKLIELDYEDFEHSGRKKLLRDKGKDLKVIKQKLLQYWSINTKSIGFK